MEGFTTYNLPKIPNPELFVPPPYCRRAARRNRSNEAILIRPSLRLTAQDPSNLLLLYESLRDECSKTLEVKLNNYLTNEAKCKLTFLVHLLPECEEALIQTLGDQILEKPFEIRFPEEIIMQLVQYETENLKCDEYWNAQLLSIFLKVLGDAHCNVVSIPIIRAQNYFPCAACDIRPELLVCFVNSEKDESFLTRTANEVFRYCLPILLHTRIAEEEERQKKQYYLLLNTMYQLIGNFADINELLKKMTSETKQMLRAQKCTVFLSDPDDFRLATKNYKPEKLNRIPADVDFTKNNFVADHVASTGLRLNFRKDDKHTLLDKNIEECTGFKTKNLLCFPMRGDCGALGAVQLCNKIGGDFNRHDEDLTNLLSVFFGVSIAHCLKYTEMENQNIRNYMSDDLMIHYIEVNEDEALKKTKCPLIHRYHGFHDFDFSPRRIVQVESVCFVLNMFEDLGFFSSFRIKKPVFTRFVMCVKEGCRDVAYHNWMHLFAAAHFGYLCLKNLQLVDAGYISNMEALAYFLSCLCHDVDYRGTNNAFQEVPTSTLASLYSSAGSVMERHRLSQTLRILNSEGCNFLEVLDQRDYSLCLNLLKDLILATDLATHFKFYKKQSKMVQNGYNKNNAEHRYIFTSLLITCADLSDHTKDWGVNRKIVEQLYHEFFTRGDLEKNSGIESINMENKEPVMLPDFEIQFLAEICLPAFKLLAAMFPVLKSLVHKIKSNILHWEATRHLFQKAVDDGTSCFELLASEDFEKNVEDVIEMLKSMN